MCQLAKAAGNLDVNSEYSYLLLGAHFSDTCVVAENQGEVVGFVSAYKPQMTFQNVSNTDKFNTLFVWQIAVSKDYRKQGIALKMLKALLNRESCKQVKYIQASITPSNSSSHKLFEALARELDTSYQEKPMFTKEEFSEEHEKEILFQIGPFFK